MGGLPRAAQLPVTRHLVSIRIRYCRRSIGIGIGIGTDFLLPSLPKSEHEIESKRPATATSPLSHFPKSARSTAAINQENSLTIHPTRRIETDMHVPHAAHRLPRKKDGEKVAVQPAIRNRRDFCPSSPPVLQLVPKDGPRVGRRIAASRASDSLVLAQLLPLRGGGIIDPSIARLRGSEREVSRFSGVRASERAACGLRLGRVKENCWIAGWLAWCTSSVSWHITPSSLPHLDVRVFAVVQSMNVNEICKPSMSASQPASQSVSHKTDRQHRPSVSRVHPFVHHISAVPWRQTHVY